MSVICRKFLLKLALRSYIFLKFSHVSTLSIWTEEIQSKTEEYSHIISSLHERRFMSQARRTRHFARSARPAQNTPFASLGSQRTCYARYIIRPIINLKASLTMLLTEKYAERK